MEGSTDGRRGRLLGIVAWLLVLLCIAAAPGWRLSVALSSAQMSLSVSTSPVRNRTIASDSGQEQVAKSERGFSLYIGQAAL